MAFCCFFLSVFLLGGLKFSRKLIGFKAERLSAVKNIKRIFSLQNAMELVKSIVKIFLFLAILFFFLHYYQNDILLLGRFGDISHIRESLGLFVWFLTYMALGVAILAGIDAIFNHYNYQKKAMMTDKELKDESKETDGNPDVKRKQRQRQQAISLQGLQQDIPKASVVITNPSHFAVALRYQEGVDKAPKMIAKGVDYMALHIRTIAKKHAVPIYEAPELARAIYYSGEVGRYIHPDLYMAVAIVLSYIVQLQAYQAGSAQMPVPVEDLQIPTHFKKQDKC
nr:EscU/YscU/HrcU family type III secretion system export apparatus switch protein [Legionella israelensis]